LPFSLQYTLGKLKMNKLVALVCVMFLVAGCTGGGKGNRLATNKVTGKVSMGGSPVPGATVTFSPVTKEIPVATGLTDAQGAFVLTTYDAGDGAVEGSYKVIVYKGAPQAASSSMPQHDPDGKAGDSGAPTHAGPAGGKAPASTNTSLLPEKYSRLETTDIQKTVVAGAQEINIELQ
jgi:hypothetical protein